MKQLAQDHKLENGARDSTPGMRIPEPELFNTMSSCLPNRETEVQKEESCSWLEKLVRVRVGPVTSMLVCRVKEMGAQKVQKAPRGPLLWVLVSWGNGAPLSLQAGVGPKLQRHLKQGSKSQVWCQWGTQGRGRAGPGEDSPAPG